MKKWLFNPFIYIAGSKALLIGWLFMLATAVVGYFSHTHFDGAIDMHMGSDAPISVFFIEQLIDWTCLTLFFFLAGLIFSRSSLRFIDIAGTMALARWPTFISAIIGFGVKVPKTVTPATVLAGITPLTITLSLVSVIFIIWMIALLYNAFTVSCNMKGTKATIAFIIALLLAEVSSSLIIHQLYKLFI